MKAPGSIPKSQLLTILRKLRLQNKKIVFTNGVFDVLHRGHLDYLFKARSYGDVLIVGMNSDSSVRRIKGTTRPVQKQSDRAAILSSLKPVDYVVLFNESTPDKLIKAVRPDVLVKGSDYRIREIVGADFVRSYGGRVRRVSLTPGRSSSALIRKLNRL